MPTSRKGEVAEVMAKTRKIRIKHQTSVYFKVLFIEIVNNGMPMITPFLWGAKKRPVDEKQSTSARRISQPIKLSVFLISDSFQLEWDPFINFRSSFFHAENNIIQDLRLHNT